MTTQPTTIPSADPADAFASTRLADDKRFRAIADALHLPILIYDSQRRIQFANSRVLEFGGYTAEQVIGRVGEELWSAEIAGVFVPVLCRAIETGAEQSAEHCFEFGPVRVRLEVLFLPLLDFRGKVSEVVAIVKDLSNQVNVDAALRRQQREVQTLTENVPDVIARFDREGRHLFVNRQIERRTGISAVAFLNKTNRELAMPEDLVAYWEQNLAQVLQSGKPVETQFEYLGPSSLQYFESRLIPEFAADGSVETVLVICRDVTDRRRAEIELEESREQLRSLVHSRTRDLEASQRSLRVAEHLASVGTLAAGISHEINNPLGAILMAAETALASHADGDQNSLQRCLESIKSDAQRCGHIVKSVLGFIREERSEKTLASLNDVIREAIERVRPYATRSNATLMIDLDRAAGNVWMNPTAIEQAVGNLLRNAIESRPDGATVHVATRATDRGYRLVIEDDGRGMPADVQAQLFEPFFTTRRGQGGVGLGMSLVRAIANDHQGQIHVETAEHRGTRVMIEFPRAIDSPPAALVPPTNT